MDNIPNSTGNHSVPNRKGEGRVRYLKSIIDRLPESPGSYQYFDEHGIVIYVGKAKNLKRRVSSYFNREHDSRKTAILVSKIWDIHYTVVKTEAEALLLENQLIKQFPRAPAEKKLLMRLHLYQLRFS